MGDVAWVLGNGPTLPVEALPRLSSEFTVGVNRILESGYCPSVLMWYDLEGYPEGHWERVAQARCVKVASDRAGNRTRAHYLLPRGTWTSWVQDWGNPREMVVSGSIGIAAARWCVALGFERVNLLGFGGAGHFYDPTPHPEAEQLFECELGRKGPRCIQADDPSLWDLRGDWTREDVSELLEEALRGCEA